MVEDVDDGVPDMAVGPDTVLIEATIGFMIPRYERTAEHSATAAEMREHNKKVESRELVKEEKERQDEWRRKHGLQPLSDDSVRFDVLKADYLPLDAEMKNLEEFNRTLPDLPLTQETIAELNRQLTGGPHFTEQLMSKLAGSRSVSAIPPPDKEDDATLLSNITDARFIAPSDIGGESAAATFVVCKRLTEKGRATIVDGAEGDLMRVLVWQPKLVIRMVFSYAAKINSAEDDPLEKFAKLVIRQTREVCAYISVQGTDL